MSKNVNLKRVLIAVLVPVLFLAAFTAWAFASPVGSSPDDDYHMASIWCAGGLGELCQEGNTSTEREVPAALLTASGCYAFDPIASAACRIPPIEETITSDRGNFDGSYPPVFYTTMSMFAGPDIAASVLLMRSFNALLFVGIVGALFFVLPTNRRGPLLWGLLITIVPLGMFIVPSVNPSSWAVLSGATLWVALVAYFSATNWRQRVIFGAVAALATIMGAGARSDSAVYAGIAVVASIILTFERTSQYLKLVALPAALIVLAVAFFFAAGQSSVISPATSGESSSSSGSLGLAMANLLELPRLWTGAMGTTGLGWLDTAMPASVWVLTVAVFFSVVFWGAQTLGARKAVAMSIVFTSLVVIPLYILVKDGVLVGNGVQPRYIYPLLIMIAGLALLKLRRDDLGLSRSQIAILLVLLTVANSIALHTNIRRYVTGIDGPGVNLNSGLEWWWSIPVSPMAVWIMGSLSFGLAMTGVFLYLVSAGRTATSHGTQHVDVNSAQLRQDAGLES